MKRFDQCNVVGLTLPYAKLALQIYAGCFTRNQSPPCKLVRHIRPAMDGRFAATCEFAPGLLEILVNVNPKTYSEIIRDKRVSNGAFRLWHLLRDRIGRNNDCWPGQRCIQEDLGCSFSSIAVWLAELEKAGYLVCKRGNQKRSSHYSLPATITVAPLLHKSQHPATVGVARPATVIEAELTPLELTSKNGVQKPLSPFQQILLEKEHGRNDKELKSIGHEFLSKDELARRSFLRKRQKLIAAALIVPLAQTPNPN